MATEVTYTTERQEVVESQFCIENVTVKFYIKDKRRKEKRQVTYLTSLSEDGRTMTKGYLKESDIN